MGIKHYIMDILFQLFYGGGELDIPQVLTLELLSGILCIGVLILPFYIVWSIVKRFL